MISVREAESIILQYTPSPLVTQLPIERAVGNILAAEVTADRDFPPFDRVTMDGIAIDATAFQSGQRDFDLAGLVAAGQSPMALTSREVAIEVMTGAVLPPGTNCVIRYEDVTIENGRARVVSATATPFQNVHRKGSDSQHGSVLLQKGTRITAAEVALLASIGKETVPVFGLPPIAIISTGNELVSISETPLPWQIRQSNNYALQAALMSEEIQSERFHLADQLEEMKKSLAVILKSHPIAILSGGVSKGKFDHVPAVLKELGIEMQFHSVSQKPGKPFWFGRSSQHTVFALPGNPVSTYLCYHRFVLPWLDRIRQVNRKKMTAVLASDFFFKPALTYFLQVITKNQNGTCVATPVEGGGSGDFVNLKDVDGFLELPPDRDQFRMGEVFPFIPIR